MRETVGKPVKANSFGLPIAGERRSLYRLLLTRKAHWKYCQFQANLQSESRVLLTIEFMAMIFSVAETEDFTILISRPGFQFKARLG